VTQLRIDLQEGFNGDAVVIKLDGEELYRARPVTRDQIGFADRLEAEARHPVELEIELPERDVRQTIQLDPAESAFVGISIADGEITTSFEELGYA
jgi:hypothetical protein